MKIFDKIKSFFKKDKQEESILEEVIETKEPVIEREVQSNCILCNEPIYIDERIRDFNGNNAHKRCVKKATKGILNGENIEDIFKVKGGEDGI